MMVLLGNIQGEISIIVMIIETNVLIAVIILVGAVIDGFVIGGVNYLCFQN